jgi:NADPH-dependent 2,4-dienoyl-CoA reductase/sulfur reductase-like enzyme
VDVNDLLRLVIVGGSDAGISAGLRAHELDPSVRPTLLIADAYPNFSICGIPYWLSGEVSERRHLAHRTREDLERAGRDLRLETLAERIDVNNRGLTVRTPDGRQDAIEYDRLVIATGAVPARPPIPGIELPGVQVLHSIGDASALQEALNAGARSAVIIGAGYIGVEMADALTKRGLDVSLIEQAPSALTTVDPELGALVVDELSRHGVRCSIGARVTGIERSGDRLVVSAEGGVSAEGEIVLVLAGVQPDTRIARDAGASVGVRGAITVDRQMRTLPEIWAAGACVETHQQLFDKPAYMPLGSTAHKQGRIAGENSVGGSAEFAGSLGTQVVKVFDLAIAATGLRESVARAEGFHPLTVETSTDDHKAYYPGAHPLRLRIVGDRDSSQLLGAQILGHASGQVSKRLDTLATAIYHRMTVAEVSDLDLSYTPPVSSPWDPVQIACQAWERAQRSRNKPIQTVEVL